jgi:hypothetical protein
LDGGNFRGMNEVSVLLKFLSENSSQLFDGHLRIFQRGVHAQAPSTVLNSLTALQQYINLLWVVTDNYSTRLAVLETDPYYSIAENPQLFETMLRKAEIVKEYLPDLAKARDMKANLDRLAQTEYQTDERLHSLKEVVDNFVAIVCELKTRFRLDFAALQRPTNENFQSMRIEMLRFHQYNFDPQSFEDKVNDLPRVALSKFWKVTFSNGFFRPFFWNKITVNISKVENVFINGSIFGYVDITIEDCHNVEINGDISGVGISMRFEGCHSVVINGHVNILNLFGVCSFIRCNRIVVRDGKEGLPVMEVRDCRYLRLKFVAGWGGLDVSANPSDQFTLNLGDAYFTTIKTNSGIPLRGIDRRKCVMIKTFADPVPSTSNPINL